MFLPWLWEYVVLELWFWHFSSIGETPSQTPLSSTRTNKIKEGFMWLCSTLLPLNWLHFYTLSFGKGWLKHELESFHGLLLYCSSFAWTCEVMCRGGGSSETLWVHQFWLDYYSWLLPLLWSFEWMPCEGYCCIVLILTYVPWGEMKGIGVYGELLACAFIANHYIFLFL